MGGSAAVAENCHLMSGQNWSLTLAGGLHLSPCCIWPFVDLSNSSASGAGKVLQEEHMASEDDVLCGEVFPLFLPSLLLGSCVWYLFLFLTL